MEGVGCQARVEEGMDTQDPLIAAQNVRICSDWPCTSLIIISTAHQDAQKGMPKTGNFIANRKKDTIGKSKHLDSMDRNKDTMHRKHQPTLEEKATLMTARSCVSGDDFVRCASFSERYQSILKRPEKKRFLAGARLFQLLRSARAKVHHARLVSCLADPWKRSGPLVRLL